MKYKVWFDVDMELWSGKDHVTSHSIVVNAENELDAIRNCGEEIRHLMNPGEFRQGLEGKVKSITFDRIEECVDEDSDSRLSLMRKVIQSARDDAKFAAKAAQKESNSSQFYYHTGRQSAFEYVLDWFEG